MQPDDPALRDRLVALRMQQAEMGRDVTRLQDSMQSGQATITPEKLKLLSMQMKKRLAVGPPELRQAYMRLILDTVTVDHHEIHLEGRPAILKRLAQTGEINALPEVLSFAQE
jgi:hypothetical protein